MLLLEPSIELLRSEGGLGEACTLPDDCFHDYGMTISEWMKPGVDQDLCNEVASRYEQGKHFSAMMVLLYKSRVIEKCYETICYCNGNKLFELDLRLEPRIMVNYTPGDDMVGTVERYLLFKLEHSGITFRLKLVNL